MKVCSRCGEAKPISEFYERKGSPDGRRNDCIPCNKSRARANRNKNLDKWTEYDRARRNNPDRVESHRRATQRARAKYIEANRDLVEARNAIRNAVRRGEVVRQPCEVCGSKPTHGHHTSYDMPLVVTWLCRPCHDQLHRDFDKRNEDGKESDNHM